MKCKLTIRVVNSLKIEAQPYEVVDTDIKGFLLRIQPSGIMTYYLSYRTKEGKRKRVKIGKHGSLTVTQARDMAQDMMAKVMLGKDVQQEKQQTKLAAEKSRMRTLVYFLNEKYGPWVQVERKCGTDTLRRIKANFKHLLTTPLEKLDTWLIEKWRAEELKRGKLATTINRDISALKAALSKAIDWELLETHPLSRLKPIKTDQQAKVRYLKEEEEVELLRILKSRDDEIKVERSRANEWRREREYELMPELSKFRFGDYLHPAVLVAINTGLRRGELLSLKWDEIDFRFAILTVRGDKAKSGKTRHIPLNSEVLKVLQDWKRQTTSSDIVFAGKDQNPMKDMRKSWARVLNLANIHDFRWHDLRHHFASRLVMAGVDLNTVRELLGHADLTMTLRYAHLAPEHKANAVAKLVRQEAIAA